VGEFMILHLVTFALGGLIGYAIWASVPLAALAAFAGLFAPRIYIGIQRNRRLKAFNDQLADILNLWVNALRSGYSVLQAMEAIGREAPQPASSEFQRVVQEVQLGIPMETALQNMLGRVESEDLDMVFTAVAIQREVGGNLAEILEVISHTIRERVRIKGEIQTLTAQGRITGYVISGLPIILTLFLYAINKQYMSRLFVGPPWIVQGIIPCGWPIVGLGLVLIAIGAAIIRRIVDIEV
jgi:tight adherence protein B